MENQILKDHSLGSQKREAIKMKKYLYTIFKKRWILLSVIFIVITLDIIYTFSRTPIYRSTVLLLIEKPAIASSAQSEEEIAPTIGDIDYYNTQYEIIKSRTLLKRVSNALGLDSLRGFASSGNAPEDKLQKMVRVDPVRNSRLVKIGVDYKDPVMATTIVNTLANLYIEQNIEQLLFMSKEILKAFPEESEEIDERTVYGELQDMSKKEALESLPSVVRSSVLQRLKAEKISVEAELAELSKRYKENHPKIMALQKKLKYLDGKTDTETTKVLANVRAELAGSLQANNIRVIDYAELPKRPASPRKMLNMVIGLFLSVSIGVGLIFVTEYMDDSIRSQEDVEEAVGLPYLGHFPIIKDIEILPYSKIFERTDKDNVCSDCIRMIRTNIQFSISSEKSKIFLLTSALPQEGKSFLSSYFAYVLAKNGLKTLLIEGDVRKPSIHKFFGISETPGLTNMLSEKISIEKVIQKTHYKDLCIITGGVNIPNPLELLSSKKMTDAVQEFAGSFDRIIIDSPPSFVLSDAPVLSRFADAVLLVVRFGVTSAEVVKQIKDEFQKLNKNITGVIVNFFQAEQDSYYSYKYSKKYYKEYYGEPKKDIQLSNKKDICTKE